MVFIFTLLCIALFVKSQIDETKWAEFDDDYAQEFDRGQIVEFADDNDF